MLLCLYLLLSRVLAGVKVGRVVADGSDDASAGQEFDLLPRIFERFNVGARKHDTWFLVVSSSDGESFLTGVQQPCQSDLLIVGIR